MPKSSEIVLVRVALVGGDCRVDLPSLPPHVVLERYGSRRDTGNGEQRRLIESIHAGVVDLVVLLVRWVGHSTSGRVRDACRRASVPVLIIPGGGSSALRRLSALVSRGDV